MQVSRFVLIVLAVGLCVVAFTDAKKPTKGDKKGKVDKAGKHDVHTHQHHQQQHEEPQETVQEPDVVVVKKVVKHVEVPADTPVVEIIEEQSEAPVQETAASKKKIAKPKTLKVLTDYDKCKLECKKQRDMVDAQDYVAQLEEELRVAKEALENQNNDELQVLEREEELPTVQKPIIEVNLHPKTTA